MPIKFVADFSCINKIFFWSIHKIIQEIKLAAKERAGKMRKLLVFARRLTRKKIRDKSNDKKQAAHTNNSRLENRIESSSTSSCFPHKSKYSLSFNWT